MARSKVAGGLVLVGLGFGCGDAYVPDVNIFDEAKADGMSSDYVAPVIRPASYPQDQGVQARFGSSITQDTPTTIATALRISESIGSDVDLDLSSVATVGGLQTQSSGRQRTPRTSIRVNKGRGGGYVGGCIQTYVDAYHATKIMYGPTVVFDMHVYYYRKNGNQCMALYVSGEDHLNPEDMSNVCWCDPGMDPPDHQAIQDYCTAQERALYIEPASAVENMSMSTQMKGALLYTFAAVGAAAISAASSTMSAATMLPACVLNLDLGTKMPQSGTRG
jgi:hypothetical protein